MSALTPYTTILIMLLSGFFLGFATFITGLLILTIKAFGPDMKALTEQTAQLAQKGLAEDVAGLVGNASSLMDAMNQLIRTATGVGVFLTLLGLALMVICCGFALQIYFAQP